MNASFIDKYQDAIGRTFSRRAALVGLAGTGVAATLAIAGRGAAGAASSQGGANNSQPAPGLAPAGSEILWDTWGVPHIFAEEAQGLFYGFGWAQAHNHGDLLVQLYAQARGRGAEFYGEGFAMWDRLTRQMDISGRGAIWYEEQSPEFRANLDAFASGINAYAAEHGDRLDSAAAAVLPITGADVCAHMARSFSKFMAATSGVIGFQIAGTTPGSNGWAIGPSHTADGHALLLANPHLSWAEQSEHTMFEAQLQAPGIYDAYGAALLGFPVLTIAFNDNLGWTHTSNTIDTTDLFVLTLDGDGYQYDGEVLPFERRTETIKILHEDGTHREELLEVRRSVHGPVIEIEGTAIAIRMVAVDNWSSAAGIAEQWWDMGRASNLAEFEDAVQRLQIPFFTIIYADREGHILSLFNGHSPIRLPGEIDWTGPVPGDTSATLWTEIHPYDDLPKVIDPDSGWVQNSNSPPWFTAVPAVLDPGSFPPDMAPVYLSWRERHGIQLLEDNPAISLERLVKLQQSTRITLADYVVDELVAAAQQSGDAVVEQAADVLAAWDRDSLASSTGTLLFVLWHAAMEPSGELVSEYFSNPWDPADPLTMPSGLADPDKAVQALRAAADRLQALFGRLDVPWGEVVRLQRGAFDIPAVGAVGDPFGPLKVLWLEVSELEATGQIAANGGDSYVAAIEFGDTVRAQVLLTYGNASQPGSPHVGDQLPLMASGEMRTAWRTREEIEVNLEAREVLG